MAGLDDLFHVIGALNGISPFNRPRVQQYPINRGQYQYGTGQGILPGTGGGPVLHPEQLAAMEAATGVPSVPSIPASYRSTTGWNPYRSAYGYPGTGTVPPNQFIPGGNLAEQLGDARVLPGGAVQGNLFTGMNPALAAGPQPMGVLGERAVSQGAAEQAHAALMQELASRPPARTLDLRGSKADIAQQLAAWKAEENGGSDIQKYLAAQEQMHGIGPEDLAPGAGFKPSAAFPTNDAFSRSMTAGESIAPNANMGIGEPGSVGGPPRLYGQGGFSGQVQAGTYQPMAPLNLPPQPAAAEAVTAPLMRGPAGVPGLAPWSGPGADALQQGAANAAQAAASVPSAGAGPMGGNVNYQTLLPPAPGAPPAGTPPPGGGGIGGAAEEAAAGGGKGILGGAGVKGALGGAVGDVLLGQALMQTSRVLPENLRSPLQGAGLAAMGVAPVGALLGGTGALTGAALPLGAAAGIASAQGTNIGSSEAKRAEAAGQGWERIPVAARGFLSAMQGNPTGLGEALGAIKPDAKSIFSELGNIPGIGGWFGGDVKADNAGAASGQTPQEQSIDAHNQMMSEQGFGSDAADASRRGALYQTLSTMTDPQTAMQMAYQGTPIYDKLQAAQPGGDPAAASAAMVQSLQPIIDRTNTSNAEYQRQMQANMPRMSQEERDTVLRLMPQYINQSDQATAQLQGMAALAPWYAQALQSGKLATSVGTAQAAAKAKAATSAGSLASVLPTQ